jgi:hypothetical protein
MRESIAGREWRSPVRQVLKGVFAAFAVGIPLGLYLHLWLHGTLLFTLAAVGTLGMGIIVVVGTRSDKTDAAADAAWKAAAPDLPPVSDRRALETAQAHLPGPEAAGRENPAAGGGGA